MRILFLDIDGVLNCHASAIANSGSLLEFSKEAVEVLNTALEATGANVVVSSSWRHSYSLDEMRELMTRQGVCCSIIGATPDLTERREASNLVIAKPRGEEIKAWLLSDEAPDNISHMCIIDDGDDMPGLEMHLVQTSWDKGLTKEHLPMIIKMLTK